jgi:hypothetical protein
MNFPKVQLKVMTEICHEDRDSRFFQDSGTYVPDYMEHMSSYASRSRATSSQLQTIQAIMVVS